LLADQPSNQILDHSVQNHPKPVNFLSSGDSSGSGLTPLNPTIDHTYICTCKYIYTVDTSGVNRLASQICHNRLFRKKLQHNLLYMISTEISSLAKHNTSSQELSKMSHLAHRVNVLVRLHELRRHVWNLHSHNGVRFPGFLPPGPM
jgi:hypothetical protein